MKSARFQAVFQHFWAIAGAVSVRAKILGIILGLVMLLGLGVTIQVRAVLSRTMDVQLQEQAASVTRDVAARATDLILVIDFHAPHQLLRETQANNTNVRYAFIVDTNGQVLAHTFGSGFPSELLKSNMAAPDEHHHTLLLNTEEGRVEVRQYPSLRAGRGQRAWASPKPAFDRR